MSRVKDRRTQGTRHKGDGEGEGRDRRMDRDTPQREEEREIEREKGEGRGTGWLVFLCPSKGKSDESQGQDRLYSSHHQPQPRNWKTTMKKTKEKYYSMHIQQSRRTLCSDSPFRRASSSASM